MFQILTYVRSVQFSQFTILQLITCVYQIFKTNFHFLIFPWFFQLYHCNKQKQPPEVFCKKSCSQKFRKIHRKNLCQSLFFNKVTGLRPVTLLKKRLLHSYFPVNVAKFLRTPFLQNTSRRLLLNTFFSLVPVQSRLFL